MAAQLADFQHLSERHGFAPPCGELDADDPPSNAHPAARGILLAVMLSIPFWLLIGFALFLLR